MPVELLINAGADPNIKDKHHHTTLYWIMKWANFTKTQSSDYSKIIELLKQVGAIGS